MKLDNTYSARNLLIKEAMRAVSRDARECAMVIRHRLAEQASPSVADYYVLIEQYAELACLFYEKLIWLYSANQSAFLEYWAELTDKQITIENISRVFQEDGNQSAELTPGTVHASKEWIHQLRICSVLQTRVLSFNKRVYENQRLRSETLMRQIDEVLQEAKAKYFTVILELCFLSAFYKNLSVQLMELNSHNRRTFR